MRHRLAAPLVLAVVACGDSGPKISLRYRPPAGAVYHFGSELRTTVSADSGPMAAMGRRQMLMRMYFTETVKGPVSGGTEIDVVFETVTMEIPGIRANLMGPAIAGLQGARVTMVMDELGNIVRADFTGGTGAGAPPDVGQRLKSGVQGMTVGFPSQPVGIGDSWTISSELPLADMPGVSASTNEVARTTLTIREIRVAGSDTSVVLDVRMDFPSEPIRLASSGGESATLRLEGGMTGRQVFSISRGTVTDATMKGTAKLHATASGRGAQGFSMQTETENSIVLLPD
jgi:hypothetical protein